MIVSHNDLKLLIEALDFWVQDCVLPVFHNNKIGRSKHWTTTYLCMTKEWKKLYNRNSKKALCKLVIDHYKYIYIREYPVTELVSNYRYLYRWLISDKPSKEAPLL